MGILKKGRHTLLKIILCLLILLVIAYVALVNILVSAALIPSFMEKLSAFEEITERSYDELMDTGITEEEKMEAQDELVTWFQGVSKEKVTIESQDGYTLVGALFYAGQDVDSAPWVVVLHGYTGWKEEMYGVAKVFQQRGYNVLVPDLRTQGESEGDYIGMGLTDAEDVLLWMDTILRVNESAEIVLYGQSMGAACSLMLSGNENLPENVNCIISDSSYTDAYAMFQYKIKDWFGLPAFPLVDSAVLALRLRGGYNLRDACPVKAVAKSSTPTLFIHGTEDQMIPVSMAYSLYEACTSSKELWIVEGAGHVQAVEMDSEAYWDKVFAFVKNTHL